MPKKPDIETAESMVFEYLKKTNRPYSVNDILLNMHAKELNKTLITKALGNLCQTPVSSENSENDQEPEMMVTSKNNGKQVIYVINQNTVEALNDEDMQALEKELADLKQSLSIAKEEEKKAQTELSAIISEPTTEELNQKIIDLKQEIQKKSEKLERINDTRSNEKVAELTPEAMENVEKEYEKNMKLWKKIKKIVMNIVYTISESAEMKPKEFMEQVGIETDEDAGACFEKTDFKHVLAEQQQ